MRPLPVPIAKGAGRARGGKGRPPSSPGRPCGNLRACGRKLPPMCMQTSRHTHAFLKRRRRLQERRRRLHKRRRCLYKQRRRLKNAIWQPGLSMLAERKIQRSGLDSPLGAGKECSPFSVFLRKSVSQAAHYHYLCPRKDKGVPRCGLRSYPANLMQLALPKGLLNLPALPPRPPPCPLHII